MIAILPGDLLRQRSLYLFGAPELEAQLGDIRRTGRNLFFQVGVDIDAYHSGSRMGSVPTEYFPARWMVGGRSPLDGDAGLRAR